MNIVESIGNITSPGAPLMREATEYSRQDNGLASMFLVEIKPESIAYRYDVSIVLRSFDPRTGQEYQKDFAKGPDEGLRSRNRNLCYEAMAQAFKHSPSLRGFFAGPNAEVIYDCKSTMYTSREISVTEVTINKEDRSIRTFIEMAVAQYGINNFLYTPIGAGKLFELEFAHSDQHPEPQRREVGMGMVFRSGIAKGVRIVKNDNNKPMAALVVDGN